MTKLNGLIAAAFTPFRGGEINVEVIPPYARYLAANGISGVFVNGTTGEGHSLTDDERMLLAETWVKAAPPNLKVLVHVGHNSLPVARELARHAMEIGVGGFAAIGPSFFKPSLEELVSFMAELAQAAPNLPFYYYHIPAMTGITIRMLDFLQVAEQRIPNLTGIKFTHENMMDYGLCQDYEGGKFDMVFGRDEMLVCGLSLGAKAAIGSTYNFAAPLHNAILKAASDHDLDRARSLQCLSMKVVMACTDETPNGLSAIRALTEWRSGLDFGPMRAPNTGVGKEGIRRLKENAQACAGDHLSEAVHDTPQPERYVNDDDEKGVFVSPSLERNSRNSEE